MYSKQRRWSSLLSVGVTIIGCVACSVTTTLNPNCQSPAWSTWKIRLNKHKDDSFLSVFIHDVVGSVRLACYYNRAEVIGDPALRPASGERIHTSAFRRQQSPSERMQCALARGERLNRSCWLVSLRFRPARNRPQ